MLNLFYEYEKTNRIIYDNVREYCLAEQLNEEYFRSSIKNRGGSKHMKKHIMITALILSIIVLGIGCNQNEDRINEDGTIYESEALGLSIGFPSEWKDKYLIEESEENISVFCKKVYEKYPGGGLLFTIERMIGELITQEDMKQEPVSQQIILQGNGYTYFTRQPSDVQYPLNDQEVSNEYMALREQIPNVSQWVSLLGENRPKAENQGFKVAGSSFFTVEIPNEWDLKALEEPTLKWSLFDSDNNIAGIFELIPYNSEHISKKTIGMNMLREYLYDADSFREIEIVLNSSLADQKTMEVIKNSLEFVGGPFNVIDLQSNAIQYISSGGKKVFGTIEGFDFSKDRPVAVRINVMQLMSSDSSEAYNDYTFEDLDKIETYTLDFGVNVAPLVAPGYNTCGIYDIETINEDFIKNQENYKDIYYDFIIGSDGQLKIILGRFARRE